MHTNCDGGMENIGFVESNDPDKAEMVKGILSQVKKSKEVDVMSEETTEAKVEETEAVEEVAETVVEETVEEKRKSIDPSVEGIQLFYEKNKQTISIGLFAWYT